jgi:hypothetical protein
MKLVELYAGIMKNVWSGKPLKLVDRKQAADAAASDKKPTAQTVVVKNNSTGEIIGKRTIYQK